jgi:hypothetical protein
MMKMSIGEIFRGSKNADEFACRIESMNGEYEFGKDEMMDLMSAYFELYPDRFSNRNSVEVLLGYRIARICITGRLIGRMEQGKRSIYGKMFDDISCIDNCIGELAHSLDFDGMSAEYEALSAELNNIKAVIDTLPAGMIKERYLGGVTTIYNIIYLIKMGIKKMKKP